MRRRVLDKMKTATEQLIELAERLNPTGVIGDGMVAEFHSLAQRVRVQLAEIAQNFEADSNLSRSICCDGHMCGCMGYSAGSYAAYQFRQAVGLDK